MKTVTLLLAVMLGLFGPSLSVARSNESEALRFACDVLALGKECRKLPVPRVVQVDMLGFYGWNALGFYSWAAEGAVFIEKSLEFEKAREVLVHEIVHYIDAQLNLTNLQENACTAEALAWHVSNQWVIEHGGEPRLDWYVGYGC